jgi:hypothetical protein
MTQDTRDHRFLGNGGNDAECTACSVDIIPSKQLWPILAAARCTHYDMLTLEDRRLASIRELPEALRRALST